MIIKNSDLSIIATRISQYPTSNRPEFLLVGRSNVGKSSFINTLLNRKELAHTSSKPGKTQTLNFYTVNDSFYLVDAPGYGFAQVDRNKQKNFGLMIEEYLAKRENLKRVFMIVDFRIKPTEDDVLMYKFLKYYNIPTTLILNKVDKVGKSKHDKNLKVIKDTVNLAVGDSYIKFSSVSKVGREEVLKLIESYLVPEIEEIEEI